MKPFVVLIAIILVTVFISCQYDPFAGDLTTKKPKLADLAGTYKFQQQTIIENRSNKADLKGTIILFADRTYKVSDVPNLTQDTGKYISPQGIISSTGKWDLETVGSVDNGIGHEKPNWGIKLSAMPQSYTYLELTGNEPPYNMMITFDDPDLAQVIIFSKR